MKILKNRFGLEARRKSVLASVLVVAIIALVASEVSRSDSLLAQFINPDQYVRVFGFRTEIANLPSQDAEWESLDGGQLQIEVVPPVGGQPGIHDPYTFGKQSVDDLVLKGNMFTGTGTTRSRLRANQFIVEIGGINLLPNAVSTVRIDPVVFPAVTAAEAGDMFYEQVQPGAPEYGNIELTAFRTQQSSDLYEWWLDVADGQDARRDVTVTLLDNQLNPVREWRFFEVMPVKYSPIGDGINSGDSTIAEEIITLRINWVEFVELSSSPRPYLDQILHDMLSFDESEMYRDLAVTELNQQGQDVRTLTYVDSFLTKYVFPELDASSEESLVEEVHFRAHHLVIE